METQERLIELADRFIFRGRGPNISGPDVKVTVYGSNTYPRGYSLEAADMDATSIYSQTTEADARDIAKAGSLSLYVRKGSDADMNLAVLAAQTHTDLSEFMPQRETVMIVVEFPGGALVNFTGVLVLRHDEELDRPMNTAIYSFYYASRSEVVH